jgi:histidinol-phosphate aminotransferase
MSYASSAAEKLVVRPGILDIEPYVGGESKLADGQRVIKLSANESPLGPSPLAIEAYRELAGSLHRYPDGGSVALRHAIARRWDIEADRIVCGTGSDELISLLCRAYAGPGDEVLQSRHGFLMYSLGALSVGATPVFAPERHLMTDVDALLDAVTPRTRIIFVANPNNPTGTLIPSSEIARLHSRLPDSVLLVIDSAYAEYVTQDDYEPGIALVRQASNVVMLRTFSKIFALGGLRIGWSYASPAVTDILNRIRGAFNVTLPTQAAAIAALEDEAFLKLSRAHNDRWQPWLTQQLTALDIDVPPSAGNFVLARFESASAAESADHALKQQGIIVRRVGAYGLPESLRITVGLEDEMRALIAVLTQWRRPS